MKKVIIPIILAAAFLSACGGHVHQFTPATCTEPEICSDCGETRGEPLGHDWQPATCTTPETCSRCGETRGIPVDHDILYTEIQAPTCTDPGIGEQRCQTCDFVHTIELPPAGHTKTIYCERCGELTIRICNVGEWYDYKDLSIRVDSITDDPDAYGYHHFLIRYTLRNNTRDYTASYSFGVYSEYERENDQGLGWKLSPEATEQKSMEWIAKDSELEVAFVQYPASGLGGKIAPDALHWLVLQIGIP